VHHRSTLVARTAAAILLVAAAACSRAAPPAGPTEPEMADRIGEQVMGEIWRGHVAGRSGDVFLVPRPGSFVAVSRDACGVTGGAPAADTAHPTPWAEIARVPLVLYGPGRVPAGRTVYEPVDLASLAPTYAGLLGLGAFRADGAPLPGITPGASPPKVVVTVVLDGGGWNTLQLHPGTWPEIERLMRDGTLYVNATAGSGPTITGAIHATMGTGRYPSAAGIPGNQLRDDDGRVVDSWLGRADPRFLRIPTLSDEWDRSHGNLPVVGALAYEGWHLGFLGHGAALRGGDRDPAVLWDPERSVWWTNERDYSLPASFDDPDLAGLRVHESGLDVRDGVADGRWFGEPLLGLRDSNVRTGTPAFAAFTGDAALRLLQEEPFGRDDVPDLLWIELKSPDTAGHLWNVVSPQEADVLRAVDEQVGRLRAALDDLVGPGGYVLALTADHGLLPPPELNGGRRIDGRELTADIEAEFGDVVQRLSATEIFLDPAAMRRLSVTPDDVARFVATYTAGDNVPEEQADTLAPAGAAETLFAGAFSASFLERLDEAAVEAFGPSSYPEGDLTIDAPTGANVG
jgi:hypothetical protein